MEFRARMNQRQADRWVTPGARSLELRYRFLDAKGQASHSQQHTGRTVNLSESGALILGTLPDLSWSERLLRGQDILELEIELGASDNIIRSLASVRWLRRAGDAALFQLGLHFERFDGPGLRILQRWLTRRDHRSERLHRFPGTL